MFFSGDAIVPREPHQIVLHVVAALPGDKVFGHIPHDCDEGLLLALTGFFTDMALSWFLGKLRMNTGKLVVNSNLDIANKSFRPFLFTISNNSLYQM